MLWTEEVKIELFEAKYTGIVGGQNYVCQISFNYLIYTKQRQK